MGYERVEIYLRLLAEAQLRQAGDQLRGVDAAVGTDESSDPGMVPFATAEGAQWRVERAGRILTAAGTFDEVPLRCLADDLFPALQVRSRFLMNHARRSGTLHAIFPASHTRPPSADCGGRVTRITPIGRWIGVAGDLAPLALHLLSLLNLTPDPATVPAVFTADRRELTEDNFDDTYAALVGDYDLNVATLKYHPIQWPAGTSSPSAPVGATGQGQLHLNQNEDAELNILLPTARDLRLTANIANAISSPLNLIPSVELHLAFWGLGAHSVVFSGQELATIAKMVGEVANTTAAWDQDQAGIAARTAGHQRRANEWTFQANLAAEELKQIGSQLIAYHNYTTVKAQVQQAQDIQSFLQNKFTSAVIYTWMLGKAAAADDLADALDYSAVARTISAVVGDGRFRLTRKTLASLPSPV